MTKSKRSLMSLAKNVLKLVLLLSLIVSAGCTTSFTPTYTKRDLDKTVEKIFKDEYSMDAFARVTGRTMWVYIPIDELFTKTSGKDPNDLVKERFKVDASQSSFSDGLLNVDYQIKPLIPERSEDPGYKLNKDVMKKLNNAWDVTRRVIFSMSPHEREDVRFYVLIAADTIGGLEVRETIYYKDMIKVMYRVISPGEYHNRVPVTSGLRPEIVGDRTGANQNYHDIVFSEFLSSQIEHRIRSRFGKPDMPVGADIDKEIEKIVIATLKIYELPEFKQAELNNLLTEVKKHFDQGDLMNFKKIQ